MAKRKVEIPKGSWLDQKGQRWMKVVFDVMTGFGGGENFIRQISLDFTCNFDFGLKKYVVNMGDYGNLRNLVLQKYPSLARYGDFRMVMTTHQVKR
jgi:hypothetical protein|nr:MAG TPA: hypothetical protein [Caudoviricetes sp.]